MDPSLEGSDLDCQAILLATIRTFKITVLRFFRPMIAIVLLAMDHASFPMSQHVYIAAESQIIHKGSIRDVL